MFKQHSLQLFVDGRQVDTIGSVEIGAPIDCIGSSTDSDYYHFVKDPTENFGEGPLFVILRESAVWKRALSAEEVLQGHRQCGWPAYPSKDQIYHYIFEPQYVSISADHVKVKDLSGNGRHGILYQEPNVEYPILEEFYRNLP